MKFLIVKLSSLGDVIHTLPIVHKIRKKYPDAQIDWLVGKKGFELLSVIKELNNVYLLNAQNMLSIQKQKYDFVIDAQGLFKSGLLSKASFGKKIIGFKNTREFADIFYDLKVDVGDLFKTNKHIVDLNLALVSMLVQDLDSGIKFLIPKINKPDSLQTKKNESLSKIAIFPATTWKSKLWPMNYWFELLNKISKDFQLYLCASNNDLGYIQQLIKMLDESKAPYENLVGKTNVKDLIYLIQNVDLVIGLDSAPLHLASAINNDHGLPNVIGIYGPTSLKRSGPYNLIEDCLYLSDLECIACRKKTCPLGHHKCMNDIVPEYIEEKIYTKLKLC